ncbi:MAG: hypothetical protein RLZZ282_816 [Verrucomicrobiota bacterium]
MRATQEIRLTIRSPQALLRVVKQQQTEVESDLLHTEKILADRKVFFLDLKQNNRGMVVKITEDVGGNRDTIMVPAEILGDFIAALSDIKATADDQPSAR